MSLVFKNITVRAAVLFSEILTLVTQEQILSLFPSLLLLCLLVKSEQILSLFSQAYYYCVFRVGHDYY